MFDLFSGPHILLLLIVALVVVGPKDLPKLLRTAGQWAGKARGMVSEVRSSFDDIARHSELDELRAELAAIRTHQPETERRFEQPSQPAVSAEAVAAEETMTAIGSHDLDRDNRQPSDDPAGMAGASAP